MKLWKAFFCLASLAALASPAQAGKAGKAVALEYSRADLEAKWRLRVQSFLDKGVIPLIDVESSLKKKDGKRHLDDALAAMDELGVALIAFDGYPSKKDKSGETYRWGYYIHKVVNAHPGRFILASNGGTNRNWLRQGDDFLAQTEAQVSGGDYPIMGEFDFRHYMSKGQCRDGKTHRDSDIPLNGPSGRRLFKLSSETGVAFAIHLEPEDAPLVALEEMLTAYPKANVIVAHFGQIRHPEKETKFGPALVRRLLGAHPNLYYDISTGQPGRTYPCNDDVLDTVIWKSSGLGGQKDQLKDAYKAILGEFSARFVVGTDYGGGRGSLARYLKKKVANIRRIMHDLPVQAKHNIGYRNAWKLLTGKDWK